jgi:predicted O-methyltransferase YrrM
MVVSIAAALAISGWMSRKELEWLATRAAEARVIVEIGCCRGRSTRALSDGTTGTVYAIDLWEDERNLRQFSSNLQEHVESGRTVLVRHDTARGVPEAIRGLVADLLFIDGDHEYSAVKRDVVSFSPLVRPGGIISGHDYNTVPRHAGVRQAVDEVLGARVQHCASIWWVTK